MAPTRRAGGLTDAQFALFATPLGNCGIAWQNDVVVATQLPEATSDATRKRLAKQASAAVGEPPSAIQHAIASITALLEGNGTDLSQIRCAFDRVGQALGRNPFPIIVPCHRVLGANGKLTGFSAFGGVDTKLRMLAIEGAQLSNEPGLFDDQPWP